MTFPLRIAFCLLLIVASCLGIFHSYIFSDLPTDVSFYISSCSCFFLIIFLILISNIAYKSGNLIANRLSIDFVEIISEADEKLVSTLELAEIKDKFINFILMISKKNIYILSRIFPFLICFLTFSAFVLYLNIMILPFLILCMILISVVICFFFFVLKTNGMLPSKHDLDLFCRYFLKTNKSGRFFNIKETILSDFQKEIFKTSVKNINKLSKHTWKSFLLLCIVFCFVCFSYVIIDAEYMVELSKNISEHIVILCFCGGSYCIFLSSLISLRQFGVKKEDAEFILGSIPRLDNREENIVLDQEKDMFLVFNGVCFQEHSLHTSFPILNNVTFSILPGEFISITGENLRNASYIFDLLLKFYKPQSGNIYIAGHNIRNLNTESLHKIFSVFKIDYGLIFGTVEDNIRIASMESNSEKVMKIADSTGILEYMAETVLDSTGEIAVSQEILLRIQMARIFLRNSKIVLMEDPKISDNRFLKTLFSDFLRFLMKEKTVILTTSNPGFIVYSSKILYIGEEKNLFGTHADLSTDETYRNFLQKIDKR
ncbi:MAG: ABC transporter ATP-binding protein/permease [Holosporales bacterium]|nr:ABC transporter ATP-binding protein/permease [Holosporales bacterium]